MIANKRVSSSIAVKEISPMNRVPSGNAMKEMVELATLSMRRVSSGNALKEMAELANKAVVKLKEKRINVKGMMRKVGKKVVKRCEVKDSDGTSIGSQQSPKTVSDVDSEEGLEWENVTLYDIQVDDSNLEAKGFDPPSAYFIQENSPEGKETGALEKLPPPENALISKSEIVPMKRVRIITPEILPENLVLVVLLLMDTTTHMRFEFVQLSFDFTKSRVCDIIKEVPNVATDESLRMKEYAAICSRSGVKMGGSKFVSEYFQQEGNNTISNLVVAVPKGMTTNQCARIASYILSDDKILSKLHIGKESSSEEEKKTIAETEIIAKQVESKTKRAFISTFAIFFVAALYSFVKHYNERISSPLGPGDILHAGEKRHKCGVLRFFPEDHTGCHSMTLENDGIGSLELYDGEELLWQIYVPTCEGCAVTMNDDGKVLIGDRGGFFSTRNPSNISPWPFRLNVKNSFKKRK